MTLSPVASLSQLFEKHSFQEDLSEPGAWCLQQTDDRRPAKNARRPSPVPHHLQQTDDRKKTGDRRPKTAKKIPVVRPLSLVNHSRSPVPRPQSFLTPSASW